MPRMMYKCTNKACKSVRVIAYPEHRVSHLGYGRTQRVYFRVDPVRGRVEMGYDSTCTCGKHAKSGVIKGFTTDHVCDARCTSATGFQCECQCGGKNHGAEHTVRPVEVAA